MKYKKFSIFKLVRKKTLEQLTEKGLKCDIKSVSRGRYLYQLKYKLIEESKEVLKTKDKKHLIEELADVFEVFNLLLKENNVSLADIITQMDSKQKERGEICNAFLSFLEIPEGHDLMEKYNKAGYKTAEEKAISSAKFHQKEDEAKIEEESTAA